MIQGVCLLSACVSFKGTTFLKTRSVKWEERGEEKKGGGGRKKKNLKIRIFRFKIKTAVDLVWNLKDAFARFSEWS